MKMVADRARNVLNCAQPGYRKYLNALTVRVQEKTGSHEIRGSIPLKSTIYDMIKVSLRLTFFIGGKGVR